VLPEGLDAAALEFVGELDTLTSRPHSNPDQARFASATTLKQSSMMLLGSLIFLDLDGEGGGFDDAREGCEGSTE